MALKQSVVASVRLVSASDTKQREVLTDKQFSRRFEGSVMQRTQKVLAQNDILQAEDIKNFFWVESDGPVRVTITGSNGGTPQECVSNGFIVWYGTVTGVLITQTEARENTVNLLWS